jgi:hypothetical protein
MHEEYQLFEAPLLSWPRPRPHFRPLLAAVSVVTLNINYVYGAGWGWAGCRG